MGGTTQERPDPRIERSRRAIREAALQELAASGYGGFSIESVAERARVGKSTIYRHYDGKLSLIADALERLNEQPVPEPGDGSPRRQVERLLVHLAEAMADPTISSVNPALVEAAEHDPVVRRFYDRYAARRRQTLVDAIAAGVGCGDFPSHVDPDLASLALAGAIFYRRLVAGTPLPPADIPQLIDTVLGTA